MKEATKYLTESYSVFLVGRAGEGKTTTAFRLVKCLVDENTVSLDRCAFVYEPEDLKNMKSTDIDLLFVDDIFGKHNAEANKLMLWRSFFSTLQAFVGSHKVRIILSSRMHIYLEYKKELDGYGVFSRTVELNSAEMTPEEKRCLLQIHLKAKGRKMDEADVEECIRQKGTDAGFPLCAQQFAIDDSLFSKKAGYFAKPFKYCLEQNIQNIDKQSFIALLYVFYKGNNLHVSETNITKMSKKSQEELQHIAELCGIEKAAAALVKDIKKMLDNLTGSYLKIIDKTFSFLHYTMYESVAKLHAKEYPDEVIKHCTIDYLCQCIRLENDESDDVLIIEKDDYRSLVDRCVNEVIENEDGRRLSKHPVFQNEPFVLEFLSTVTKKEKNIKDFFSKGVSFNYVGVHGFLYHLIVNGKEDCHFLKEAQKYLRCSHSCGSDETCWKCKVKSEALCAVCGTNRKDLYTTFRAENVQVTTPCLYEAVLNSDVDPELIKSIISDLTQSGNHVPYTQDLEYGLWMAMAQSDGQIFGILNENGLHFIIQTLYFALKHKGEKLDSSILNELTRIKKWQSDDMYTARAMTEAHATGKTNISLLIKAEAKLILVAVYWATIEHDFEEVKCVIEKLKETDTFDPESYEMAWAMAMAMNNEDKRIDQHLKVEGVIPTASLVYALAEIGHDVDGIFQVIEDLKKYETWDPEDLRIAAAYMASCRRGDQRLTDLFVREGVGINPACLNMAAFRSPTETNRVLDILKETGRLDPTNKYIARSFVWSIENKDKSIYSLFVSEG